MKKSADIYLELFELFSSKNAEIWKSFKTFFAPYGLTDAQFQILQILKKNNYQSISRQLLVERLDVTRANVTIILDRMEKNGYVKRTNSKTDKRTRGVTVASLGKQKLEKIEKKFSEKVALLFSNLSSKDRQTLTATLNKIQIK